MLKHPQANRRGEYIDNDKEKINLKAEFHDPLKAQTIMFKFICHKPALHAKDSEIPKRLQFGLRFFTYPEIKTEPVILVRPGTSGPPEQVQGGEPYYLARDIELPHSHGQRQRIDNRRDPDMVFVTFEIDPSISKIECENEDLARYLKERYLNFDVYDADTKFLYAEFKLPLYEVLRQTKQKISKIKECNACAPSVGADMRGSF